MASALLVLKKSENLEIGYQFKENLYSYTVGMLTHIFCLGHKLIVVNMSQQSDSTDLLGG